MQLLGIKTPWLVTSFSYELCIDFDVCFGRENADLAVGVSVDLGGRSGDKLNGSRAAGDDGVLVVVLAVSTLMSVEEVDMMTGPRSVDWCSGPLTGAVESFFFGVNVCPENFLYLFNDSLFAVSIELSVSLYTDVDEC